MIKEVVIMKTTKSAILLSVTVCAASLLAVSAPVKAANSNQAQTSVKATATHGYNRVVSGVATIKNSQGAILYSSPNTATKTSRVLPNGSRWKVSLLLDNGLLWYRVGSNQWILESDANYEENKKNTSSVSTPTTSNTQTFNTRGVATVTYRTPIVVWATPGADPTSRYLPRNSAWRYFKVVVANGQYWYNLVGNQWIPQQYVNNNQDPLIGHYNKTTNTNTTSNSNYLNGMVIQHKTVTVQNSNGRGTYVRNSKGVSTGRLLPNGSRWKSFGYINNGFLMYNLGGNQWIYAYETK
jgi:hypothetical protein